jgi:capsid portal protein
MKKKEHFSVVNLTQQEIPIITEDVKSRYNWVPVGIMDQDDFFQLIIDAYNTSTTNAACVEGLADLIYGKGLYSKNEGFNETLFKLLPQEDVKRLAFDFKLFGNGALTVYWNDDHTKIKKFHHTPVQNWRAQKLHMTSKVEKYYYCQDWSDMRQHKNKVEVPAFGTSTEKMELLWFKNYAPGKYYYSLPDWISALQFAFVEAELSNLHLNNIENGFLPLVMLNMNNGVPAPEERQTIENLIESKFTGTRNAGRFMLSFNDDANAKPTVDIIQTENLHEKYTYVADYAQDRILVSHRITSPLLFGIRTANNGFSSQSEEMMTAFSIMQTMTISPFQNVILNTLQDTLKLGGWGEDTELYFEQLTPLAILSQQAEDTGTTIEEAEDDVNEQLENPNTTEENLNEIYS